MLYDNNSVQESSRRTSDMALRHLGLVLSHPEMREAYYRREKDMFEKFLLDIRNYECESILD